MRRPIQLLAENVNFCATPSPRSSRGNQGGDAATAVERCVEIIGRLRGRRAERWGLEHLNARTRRRDVETDRARVAAAAAAYERAYARNLRDHEHAQGEASGDLERSGGIALVDLKEYEGAEGLRREPRG